MTDAARSRTIEDRRETILRREATTHPDPRSRIVFGKLADALARTGRTTTPAGVSPDQRRALLVSAAVLMDQASRSLDECGASASGVWLTHAIRRLNLQMRMPD